MSINTVLSFASVMKSVGGVLLAVVILLAMVTVHEFGHYLAGRILNFKINEFAVGFGPALFKKRSKKTGVQFSLRIVPLGGYCAFDGEDEFESEEKQAEKPFDEYEQAPERKEPAEQEKVVEPKGERFNDQAPWKRIIVLVAGATMNYLFALVLIAVMFISVGRPAFEVTVEYPPEISEQEILLAPTDAPLKTGDVILEIDGRKVYMFSDFQDALDGKKQGERVQLTVMRAGQEQTATLELIADANIKSLSDTNAFFRATGLYGLYTKSVKEGFWDMTGGAFSYSFKIGGVVLRSLGELLTGKLGVESMGGPITTITQTSSAVSQGFGSFLMISALIGVNLAVFNLLPIPALDGCKVIFCIIEWIRKKPVNRRVETIIHLVGILFLFGFAIFVDLVHLF